MLPALGLGPVIAHPFFLPCSPPALLPSSPSLLASSLSHNPHGRTYANHCSSKVHHIISCLLMKGHRHSTFVHVHIYFLMSCPVLLQHKVITLALQLILTSLFLQPSWRVQNSCRGRSRSRDGTFQSHQSRGVEVHINF